MFDDVRGMLSVMVLSLFDLVASCLRFTIGNPMFSGRNLQSSFLRMIVLSAESDKAPMRPSMNVLPEFIDVVICLTSAFITSSAVV